MPDNLYTPTELKPIQFRYYNRNYDIQFKGRTLQIRGESGTGKTLFASDFAHRTGADSVYRNSAVIDYYTPKKLVYNIIKNSTYDFVIIDNADLVVTEEIDDMILHELLNKSTTQWVLIGRNFFKSVRGLLFCGELESVYKNGKYCFTINYNI